MPNSNKQTSNHKFTKPVLRYSHFGKIVLKPLLFTKVAIMSKIQSSKIKGSACNVPAEIMDVSNLLPRQANSNGLFIIKLKRKLEY